MGFISEYLSILNLFPKEELKAIEIYIWHFFGKWHSYRKILAAAFTLGKFLLFLCFSGLVSILDKLYFLEQL